MAVRSTNRDRETHYKALQTEKASLFGSHFKIPVCKSCYEKHVRCPGPEFDDDGNYDYSKKCMRCIDYGIGIECDFECKMSALPRRSLEVMTEEELSTVMRTNKEMGKMHPREATMCNIPRRRVKVEHFRHLPFNLNQSDLRAHEQKPSTQPFTTQPSRLILPDGRLVEYTTKPSQVMLPNGRVIEYTFVAAEHDNNVTSEQTYEAASNEIALAIQEQEDRGMQLGFLPLPMYLEPSAFEEAPANQL